MEDIIKKLADFKSPSAAEHCQETLQLVMDNAVETVRNKILDLLETVADKVSVEEVHNMHTISTGLHEPQYVYGAQQAIAADVLW